MAETQDNQISTTVETELKTIEPSEIGFSKLQKDECADKDILKVSPICPDCIPNENLSETDWLGEEEPYLDKKTCEYIASVEKKLSDLTKIPDDIERDASHFYWDVDISGKAKGYETLQDWAEDPVRIRAGIKHALRHFEKEENEKIVCAFGGCAAASLQDMEDNREVMQIYRERIQGGWPDISDYVAGTMPWLTTAGLIWGGPFGWMVLASQGLYLGFRWIENWAAGNAAGEEKEEREAGIATFDIMLKSLIGSDVLDAVEGLQEKYGDVNPLALEWNTYVPKQEKNEETGEWIGTAGVFVNNDEGIVRYHVRIPSISFDAIPEKKPDAEEEEKEGTTDGEIILENKDWRIQYSTLRTGLNLYRYEYDLFRVLDGGNITFADKGGAYNSISFKDMDNNLINFKKALEKFLNKNDYAFSYEKINPAKWGHTTVEEISIDLSSEGDNKPLYISSVSVTAGGCPAKKIKRGLPEFRTEAYNSAIMYLLLEKDTALMAMQADEMMPVSEFAKDFIYPEVSINMGTASRDTEENKSLLGCIADGFPLTSGDDWTGLLEDLVVGTWDTFRSELTKRMCTDKTKAKDPGLERWFARGEVQAAFEKSYQEQKAKLIEDAKQRIKSEVQKANSARIKQLEDVISVSLDGDWQQHTDEIDKIRVKEEEQASQLLEEQMGEIMREAREMAAASPSYKKAEKNHPYFKDFKATIMEKFDYEESLTKLFVDFFKGDKKKKKKDQHWSEAFLAEIGICGMMVGLKKFLNCLLGQVSLEDAIKICFEKAMSAISLEQFFFLFKGLPLDEQIAIQEDVEKALEGFGDGTSMNIDTYLSKKENKKKKVASLQDNWDQNKYQKLMSSYTDATSETNYVTGTKLKTPERKTADYQKAVAMSQKFKLKMEKIEKNVNEGQGSIGDATADVFGIVVKAYMKAFMRVLNTSSMLRLLRSIPGANLIPDGLLNFFSCPGKSLVNPPLEKMLDFKKWKLNICDPTKPVINIQIPKLFMTNPWKFIKDAFVAAVKKVVMELLMKLALQFLKALEEALCKMLSAVGKGALNAVTGNNDGNPFMEAFKDVFCGPGTDDEEVKKAMQGALQAAGIADSSSAAKAAEDITAAMAMSLTTDEMIGMWIDVPKNPTVVRRIGKAIRISAPEYEDIFGTPEKIEAAFRKMSDLIPNEHKQALRDARDKMPLSPTAPALQSVCLTSNEVDEWNNLRNDVLQSKGVAPKDAEQQIQQYNNRAKRQLAAIAEQVAQSPDEIVAGEIQKMFQPTGMNRDNWGDLPGDGDGDDGCDDKTNQSSFGNAAASEPAEVVALTNSMMDRIIDTIGAKFSRELGGWGGILSKILSDEKGRSLGWHNLWANFFLTRSFYYDSREQAEADDSFSLLGLIPEHGFLPPSVAYYLYTQLKQEGSGFEYVSTSMSDREDVPAGTIFGSYDPGWLGDEIAFQWEADEIEKSEIEMVFQAPYFESVKNKAGYCSQVILPEVRESFDYKINIQSGTNPFLKGADHIIGYTTNLSLTQEMNSKPEIDSLLSGIEPSDTEKYRIRALRQFLKNKCSELVTVPFDDVDTNLYDSMATLLFGIVRDCVLDIPDRDGKPDATLVPDIKEVEKELKDKDGNARMKIVREDTGETVSRDIPQSFLYGHVTEDLAEEHFNYVGPNGEEYDYNEEDAVLGKMEVPHDRVHILDPKQYGGKYKTPPLYIEDAKHKGWRAIAAVLDPEIAQCPDENILRISKVKEYIKKSKNRAKMDERLYEARGECFLEVPFDKILDKESFAMIEGMIKSFIRVILIEGAITVLPVISTVEFNDRNYDSSIFQIMVHRLADEAKTTNPWLPRKIEKKNYWLAFLEQSVQMYQKMWDRGDIKERPDNVVAALNTIREMQEVYKMDSQTTFTGVMKMWTEPNGAHGISDDHEFYFPGKYYDVEKKSLLSVMEGDTLEIGFGNPFDFSKQYAHYCALAYQSFGESIFHSDHYIKVKNFRGPKKKNWEFASKILAIRSVEKEAMVVLTELIKFEFEDIMKEFANDWKPDIVDINRYLLNTEIFASPRLKNFGTRDMEEKVANGELPSYGDIDQVVSDVENSNPPISNSVDDYIKFKLEKYIRVNDKEDESELPMAIKERDYTLRDVVNMDEFQAFVNSNKEDIKDYYISDLFGDAKALYSVAFETVFNSGVSLKQLQHNKIELTDTQIAAFRRGNLIDTRKVETTNEDGEVVEISEDYIPKYGKVLVPEFGEELLSSKIKTNMIGRGEGGIGEPSTISYIEMFKIKEDTLPKSYMGSVGIRYGLRLIAMMPKSYRKADAPSESDFKITKKEKSYFFNGSAENFILPIASVEIDVIDHKMESFGWSLSGGGSFYPYDLDCLLRKLVETPEYELLFKYIFNAKAAVALPAIISNLSFHDSLGVDDGWSLDLTVQDDDGTESGGNAGDTPTDDGRNFKGTKALIRTMFSSYYLSDDFEEDGIELSFQFMNLLKMFKAGMLGSFKQWGKHLSFWWKMNLQDRPYDKDGKECKSNFDNLF